MKTSSITIIIISAVLGLFFGNALGGLSGALILGVISAAGAWFAMWRYESREPSVTGSGEIEDPPFARFLFKDPRSAALWLPLRIFIGWGWLDAGMHKFSDPKWMDTGESIRGYWERAVVIPDTGRAVITYDWWRGFLQMLLDTNSHTWFAKVIVFGEMLVGIGLIAGALVGIAAFGGILMNLSFMLSGSSSTNPVMLTIAFLLVLGWKVAGWVGVDRVLLPMLGTPWHGGVLVRREGATRAAVT